MNLSLAHRLIGSAEKHPGFKVRSNDEVNEVHLMAEAGLIEADESKPAEAVITRITHAGRQFYHAFRNAGNYLERQAGQHRTAH